MQIICHFYTNLLAPYMFHRWKLIEEAFPGSKVIVTRKPDPGRPWLYDLDKMEFTCEAAPETISLSNHLAWSKDLLKSARAEKGQRVLHLMEDVSGLNMLTLVYRSGNDAYVMVNDGGFPETTRRLSQGIRWNLIGKKCFGVITAGKLGKRYMNAWGFPPEKIYNSYLSHDLESFLAYRDSDDAAAAKNRIRSELELSNDDLLVLCISRLLDWKRVEDLAESLQYLEKNERKRIFPVLLGDGPYKSPLQIFERYQDLRFRWIPGVPYEEVMAYYAASDFFVLPSEGDIWGMVVNEALSMGKPVVCTDRIGAAELVENGWNGFKVSVRDPKALSSALQKLISDHELRQTMSKNAMTIEKTWHSGLFVEELKRIINDLGW